ncbi:MAG: hypothetical protein NC311_17260, partial [Muribaculaceae bacterium]|nr:hypothetical protein [Muribaculaceae bacterium]
MNDDEGNATGEIVKFLSDNVDETLRHQLYKDAKRDPKVGDNPYVVDFIKTYNSELIEEHQTGFYYDGLADNPLAPELAPQVAIQDEHYYIYGSSLGQTMIRVKVPGLSASAYVLVKVLADNSSKAEPMVAVGQNHTLALKSDGTVWSWGDNSRGQLGREGYESMGQVIFPNMVEFAINRRDSGKNYFDRHGIMYTDPVTKVQKPITTYAEWYAAGADTGFLDEANHPWDDPDPIVYIVAGANVSFAMTESGILYAWGDNSIYQLSVGDLEKADPATPGLSFTTGEDGRTVVDTTKVVQPMNVKVKETIQGKEIVSNVTSVGTLDLKSTYDAQHDSYLTTVYFTVDGGTDAETGASQGEYLYGIGHQFDNAIYPVKLNNGGMAGGSITQLAGDYALSGGTVYKLSNDPEVSPEPIKGFTITKIEQPDPDEGEEPVAPTPGTNEGDTEDDPLGELDEAIITQIAVGADHLLALDMYGGVWAMGRNDYGQLGTNASETDTTKVHSEDKPVRVAPGEQGIGGGLGYDTLNPDNHDPETMRPQVTKIAAGQYSSYARTSNNKVYAWGLNDHGQLGVEPRAGATMPVTEALSPMEVDSQGRGDHYYSVFAGFFQSVNLDENGMLWAAGNNDYDQLANGTAADTMIPTLVGDSALQVTIANNYTTQENDKQLHLGDYVFLGYNFSPNPKTDARYDYDEVTGTYVRVEGTREGGLPKGDYYFDRDAKTKVAPDNLTLLSNHTYYLETEFDVFCLFTSNDATGFEYGYNLAFNNNNEMEKAAYTLDETNRQIQVTGTVKTQEYRLMRGDNPANAAYYTVTDSAGNVIEVGDGGWFSGVGGDVTITPATGTWTSEFKMETRKLNTEFKTNATVRENSTVISSAQLDDAGITAEPKGENRLVIKNALDAYRYALVHAGTDIVETNVTGQNQVGASLSSQSGWFVGNNGTITITLTNGASVTGNYELRVEYAKQLIQLDTEPVRSTTQDVGRMALQVTENQISGKARYVPITIVDEDGPEADTVVWKTGTKRADANGNLVDVQIRDVDADTQEVKHQDKGKTVTKTTFSYYMPYTFTQAGANLMPAKVSTGYGHTMSLRADNTIWAYGLNEYGQLGVGTDLGDNATINGVAAGGYDDPKEIQTWVWNAKTGKYERQYIIQVSEDDKTLRYRPKVNFIDVSAGYDHTLAVDADGNIWAAGNNDMGQLGLAQDPNDNIINQTSYFIKVLEPSQAKGMSSGQRFVAVSAGYKYSLALASDGTVWAWGNNDKGQLGVRSTSAKIITPTKLTLININAVSAGKDHSLFTMYDGSVYASGSNANGKLGLPDSVTSTNSPVFVPGLSGVMKASAGDDHSVAVTFNLRVF